MKLVFFASILPLIVTKAHSESVIVKTSMGSVSGFVDPTGQTAVFKGIPFAAPPVGQLRFLQPQKVTSWNPRIVDTTQYRHACMSNTTHTSSPQSDISEDCLYLNVFADRRCLTGAHRCPVIAYIHGGGFFYDSAVMFNDSQIIAKYASRELIFVIPAYRLGIFGFLDFGNDRVVKRNIGMHDILAALQWIQVEIANFGGDAKSVTLMGHSSGGNAALYLVMSPLYQYQFFHRVISLSPTLAYMFDLNLNISRTIAKQVGCLSKTPTETVKCLRSKPALQLLGWQRSVEDASDVTYLGTEVDGELFPESWPEMKRKLNIMIGTTKDEYPKIRNKLETCTLGLRKAHYLQPATLEACMNIYKDEEPWIIFRDYIHASIFQAATQLSKRAANVFLSSFDYLNHTNHAQDLPYVIGLHRYSPMSVDDKAIDRLYPELIGQFAKTGRPRKDWSPLHQTNYFSIRHVTLSNGTVLHSTMKTNFYPNAVKIWLHDLKKIDQSAKYEHFPLQLAVEPGQENDAHEVFNVNLTGPTSAVTNTNAFHATVTIFCSLFAIVLLTALLLLVKWFVMRQSIPPAGNGANEKTALLASSTRQKQMDYYYDARSG